MSMNARPLLCALFLAAGCVSGTDARSFDNHVLRSQADPALTLQIDPAFDELTPLRFPIGNQTDAERRIYVDAGSDGVIARMIVVQFERAQESSDFRFVFRPSPPRRFGDNIYRFGAFVFDDAAAATQAPDREAGRTRVFLQSRGFRPPRFWRIARLARVSDAEGLTEVIIFYQENADAHYPNGLAGVDEDGDLPITGDEQEALARRMEAAVRPIRG
ncbi:MAG TPA: hypothetical protein VFV70_05960 [Hyphomonadaceae bacterium]|nr:hypothetical protein [Hyphomonadaceae bacterium]